MDALLVFPHQLFVRSKENTTLIYIEDAHFFDRNIPFHKHKLMLHRASMQWHFDSIESSKQYFNFPLNIDALSETLKTYETVYAYDPVDHDIKKAYQSFNIQWLETPNFLTSLETIESFFKNRKRYFMHDFYIHQRKRLNILMDDFGPVGGQYSYDQENRKALPKDVTIPALPNFKKTTYISEAEKWVNTNFPDNPGSTDTFNFPTTREQALQQLKHFLDNKFNLFGPYQDALSDKDPFLFHSNLSSSLNTGLLSPNEIVEAALQKDVPIASKEGFIRQIIGWREFIRSLYHLEGKVMKQSNYLKYNNYLSDAWYTAKTDIPIVDQTIEKLLKYAYSHHIERLMVLGNIMFLLNIHPHSVYTYFMAMHIDAYDWVMVPNIYGMSQFASGPIMTTKPYFSGSNYLKKMGVKDGEWAEQWDALFYLFLRDHKPLIEKNPRIRVLLRNLFKKDSKTLDYYETIKSALLKKTAK